ncbi:MAG: hypothetical protein AAGJ97_05915, partial [Planctomycetota bacterium]
MTRRQLRWVIGTGVAGVAGLAVGVVGLYAAVMRAPEAARREAAAAGLPTSLEELAAAVRPVDTDRTSRPSWLSDLRRLRNDRRERDLFKALQPVRDYADDLAKGQVVDPDGEFRERLLADLRSAQRDYENHVALARRMVADESRLDPTTQTVRASDAPDRVTLDDVIHARWFADVDSEVTQWLDGSAPVQLEIFQLRASVWAQRHAAEWLDAEIRTWGFLRNSSASFGKLHKQLDHATLAELERRLRDTDVPAEPRRVLLFSALAGHAYEISPGLPQRIVPEWPGATGERVGRFVSDFLTAQAEATFWDAYREAAPRWSGPLPKSADAVDAQKTALPIEIETPAEFGRAQATDHVAWLGLFIESVTMRRALAVAVVAERFRREHGRWPDTVGEAMASGDEAGIDPMTGGPLRITRTGAALIIYGVGADRTDHGGELPFRHASGRPRSPFNFDVLGDF